MKPEAVVTKRPLLLFEQHGFVRREAEPLRGFVRGVEDLKILARRLHALIRAGKIERRIRRSHHRPARVMRKNLALKPTRERLHGFKIQIGAGESREVDLSRTYQGM